MQSSVRLSCKARWVPRQAWHHNVVVVQSWVLAEPEDVPSATIIIRSYSHLNRGAIRVRSHLSHSCSFMPTAETRENQPSDLSSPAPLAR